MLNKCLLILATGLVINTQAVWAEIALEQTEQLAPELSAEQSLVEFTELEYQLLEISDLLSLSQQIKYTAQRLIEQGSERSEPEQNTLEDVGDKKAVYINHAQHFAIAKSLASHWREEAWQQKLLELIHSLPLETQILLQQQINNPMLISAREKEKAAISVQHSGEYQLYMNKLRQRPPGAARWQLVENLDRQSGFSAMIIQARAVVNKAIQQQVEGWQPEEFWQNQTRQEVLEFLFYAYRKTPNNQLKHITDSFNQVELQHFYQQVRALVQ
jgi:hypothetical protein